MHAFNPMLKPELNYFARVPFTTVESFLLLLPQTILVYPLLYFVLPRYVFKDKYMPAILWSLVFLSLMLVINTFMITRVNAKVINFLLPEHLLLGTARPQEQSFFMGILGSMKGALSGAALAACVKMVKHYYTEQNQKWRLQKENTETQLQLLTAQVHPHFLFNTLNNIYSKAQTESPGTASMIMELSHILRYVLDEGRVAKVPLEHELQMVRDYINLEKMRYDEKLDLHLSLPSDTDNLYIAPLLLLPFVENCFKHGASKMLRNPWISVKMELQGDSLIVKIINGRKDQVDGNSGYRRGTGIQNVKQRLDLLYRDKYELEIVDDREVFIVNLRMELVRIPQIAVATQTTNEYA
ncbi:MAG TPA: histidine kinase [Chitinophagaceae bacterium]|nr:histidine kinase [Chitinophagaceae bacterium]